MDNNPILHEFAARRFIDYCKDKFGWRALTNYSIMDVGCGEYGLCGKVMVEKFPNVREIIGIDSDPKVALNFKLITPKIHCFFADIEKRETLQSFERKMNKVISIHAFHEVVKKEEAFRNVFRVLKRGGEAAILFVMRTLMNEWLNKMLRNPKWLEAYQRSSIVDICDGRVNTDCFKEMVERIGFQIMEYSEEKLVIPYPSEEECKESLYTMYGNSFKLPPEAVEQFKEESLQVLLNISEGYAERIPCYRSTKLCFLLIKPWESSKSF